MKMALGTFKNIICLFLLIAGSGSAVFAKPVRILISIRDQNTSHKFKEKFERLLFKNGYDESEFDISENTDQYQLHLALTGADTRALIWVSHGATPRLTWKMKRQLKKSGASSIGISGKPELIDFRGDDVAPVFNRYSSNLKFVAVIGCNSAGILDYVGSGIARDDSIVKMIPDHRVIAQTAIKRSVLTLNSVELDSNHTTTMSTRTTSDTITIQRSIPTIADPSTIRPLRVLSGNTLLGVIPSLKPGESRTDVFTFSETVIRSLKLESGQPIMTSPQSIEFGNIKVLLSTGQTMKPFTKPDGSPFGLNTRVFLP